MSYISSKKVIIQILLFFNLSIIYGQNIYTIAGGVGDGFGPLNYSSSPNNIVIDTLGNIYIAEFGNNRVRKIDVLAGTISTVVGDGKPGYIGDNGLAKLAQLNNPNDVALDRFGNLYIADVGNNVIRKVNLTTNIITTVAGNGSRGFGGDGGLAIQASLNRPTGITLDSIGNIYISDAFNYRLRKVTSSTGLISTIAGNGVVGYSGDGSVATAAKLNGPYSTCIDNLGNIYLSDWGNHVIRKVNLTTNIITTICGNAIDGAGYNGDSIQASSALLSSPRKLLMDKFGYLYIADSDNHRLRKINLTTGIIYTVAGNGNAGYLGDGGPAVFSSLNRPDGIAFDQIGNIIIVDVGNRRIRKISKTTGIITTISGNGISGYGFGYGGDGGKANLSTLANPVSTVLDSAKNIYIADYLNNRIRKISSATGNITTVAGNGIKGYSGDLGLATNASLNGPADIALDAIGNLYIAEDGNNKIRKVNASTGIITTIAGSDSAGFSGDGGPAKTARLSGPNGLAIDKSGNLFISDHNNNRVRKVTSTTGVISTVAGNGNAEYSGDNGDAIMAGLQSPSGLLIDHDGNLIIADAGNNRIRKVNTISNTITTICGTGEAGFGGDDGSSLYAKLNSPTGLSIDQSGSIYIADYNNDRVRKITVFTGVISTIAGNGTLGYIVDSISAISARLARPAGVSVDNLGNIYIADQFNNRIRKVVNNAISNNIIVGNQTICARSLLNIISCKPIGGNGYYTYTWLKSTANASNGFKVISNSNTISLLEDSISETAWYRRLVTSGNLTDTSNAVLVNVLPSPTAGLIAGKINDLQTATPYLYNINQQIGVTYNWIVNNAAIISGQGTNAVTIQWINNGLGKLTVVIMNPSGCTDTSTISVGVGIQPSLVSFNPTSAKSGEVVTINGFNLSNATAVKFGGVNAQSFNVISSNKIEAVVGNGSTGDVTVVTPNGNISLAGFTYIPTTGLLSKSLFTGLYVYPNPTKESLTIDLRNTQTQGNINLQIHDVLGRLVYEELLDEQSIDEHTISVSRLSTGNYILTLKTKDKIEHVKFVKE